MASLPPLPGPPIGAGKPLNLAKGAFMQGFVGALMEQINRLAEANRRTAEIETQRQQSMFAALLQTGDPESIKAGLTGLLDPKAGKKALQALVGSPTFQQVDQVTSQLFGTPTGGAVPSEKPAAMPTSTIPRGTAAPAALPLGAGQAGVTVPGSPLTDPSHTEPGAFAFEQNLLGARAPAPTPSAQPDQYAAAIAWMNKAHAFAGWKYRFDPQLRRTAQESARKSLQLLEQGRLGNVPFDDVWQRVMDVTAPEAARIDVSRMGRTVPITTEEAKRFGIAVPPGLASGERFNVDARLLTQAGATTRAEARAGSQRVQVLWDQPKAGGPRHALYRDPATNTMKPLLRDDGKPVTDSPEFRSQISRDAEGNEWTNWVIPGGGGGTAPSGLPAPPAALSGGAPAPTPKPEPTRAALTFPKEQALGDDFRKAMQPYNEQADATGKMLSIRNDPSGAAQITKMYSFITNLDKSVVRPGELELLREAQSLYQRLQVSLQRGLSGEDIVVSPKLIEGIERIAQRAYASTAERQAQVYAQYLEKAKKEGLDAKFIIGEVHPVLRAVLIQKAQAGQLSSAEQRLLKLMAELSIQ